MNLNGIFAIDKPKGMTSHDVVNIVRKATGVKRVGHGGTLDPLATGVLIIAVGRENTKLLDQYVKGDKEYLASITLGETSVTDDSEGPFTKITVSNPPARNDIERTIQKYIGEFPQTPPPFSAKKVGGKVSYKIARKGKTLQLEPVIVKIMDIQIERYIYPNLIIRVHCGTGVYIRSLARDIGKDLQTGGYLSALERTKVAGFTKDDCITIDQVKEVKKEEF